MGLPGFHHYLRDEHVEELLRDYNLDAADIERINAVAQTWGDEDAEGPHTVDDAYADLRRRVLAVIK